MARQGPPSHTAVHVASCQGAAPWRPPGREGCAAALLGTSGTPRGQDRPQGPSLLSAKDSRGSSTLSWGLEAGNAASPRPAAPVGKPWACSGEAARGGSLRAGEAGGCPGPPARLPVTLTPGVQGEGPTPVTSVALAGMTAAPLSHRQTSPCPCAGGDFKRLERQGPPLCPVLSASWPWDRPAARPGRGWAGPVEGRAACSTHACPRCWAAALPGRRPPRACPGPQVSPRPPLVTHMALCWGHRIESLTVRPERFGPTVRSAHPAECHSPERGLPRPLRWPGACAAGPPARRTVSRILPPC